MNIGQESARLEDLVGNDGELTKKRQEMVKQSAKLQTALYSAKQAKDNFKTNRLRIKSIMKKKQKKKKKKIHDSFCIVKIYLESVENQFIDSISLLMQKKKKKKKHEQIS